MFVAIKNLVRLSFRFSELGTRVDKVIDKASVLYLYIHNIVLCRFDINLLLLPW